MKKSNTSTIVISAIMLSVILATTVFWIIFILKIINGLAVPLTMAGAALTIVCEADIFYVLIYFTSDKWTKTKAKSVLNIICAVLGAVYSAMAILSCAGSGSYHIDNYTLDMLIFYTPILSIIFCIIIRGAQFLRFIFSLPYKNKETN